MSTITSIGAGAVGAVLAVAGIATVEMQPDPPSAIVVCESFFPEVGGVAAIRGCRLDGRTCQGDRRQFFRDTDRVRIE